MLGIHEFQVEWAAAWLNQWSFIRVSHCRVCFVFFLQTQGVTNFSVVKNFRVVTKFGDVTTSSDVTIFSEITSFREVTNGNEVTNFKGETPWFQTTLVLTTFCHTKISKSSHVIIMSLLIWFEQIFFYLASSNVLFCAILTNLMWVIFLTWLKHHFQNKIKH